jgi:hypothetical protein
MVDESETYTPEPMTPLPLFTRVTLLCTVRNILAHVAVFEAAHLTPEEIGIFGKMYSFHPRRREMVQVEPLINMVGTMASFSQQNKLDKRVDRYCEFISSTKAVRDIWTSKCSQQLHYGLWERNCSAAKNFKIHINHMQQILEEFA